MRRVHEGGVLDLIVDVFVFIEGERPAETAEHQKQRVQYKTQISAVIQLLIVAQ